MKIVLLNRAQRKIRCALGCLLIFSSMAFAAVDGTVMNATTGKPQAGALVTVIQPGASGMQTLGTTKSAADGKFSIAARIPPGPAIVQAIYQGAIYNLPLTPGTPSTGITLNVFDATKDPASGKIAQHMMVIEPSPQSLEISETFLAQNDTKQTFVDNATGSIQFYVPEAGRDKIEITIAAPGGMPITRPGEATKTPGVYKATYPIKPGETRFDVKYSLPAGNSFSGRNPNPAAPINIVTPAAVTLSGDGIESKGQEPQTQAHIYATTAPQFTVAIEGTGSLRGPDPNAPQEDTGQPEIKVEPARIYSKLYWVLGLTLAILALGGFTLYRKGTSA